jgi:Mg/Co/Ni transporter MgtE
MKVKDVIKSMQNYNLEDEVVILWWTKDIFDDEVHQISDEVWSKVVKTLDDESNLDFANQVISDEILDVLRENEVDA